jgi:Holliday junction resolvasome RuvABC endonuclease subunit
MESINQTTILGIDPGSRFLGLAVVRGPQLLHYAVHTLRNGSRPYDLLGQARAHVLRAIGDFRPALVAIEEPLLLPSKRAALVSAIAQELHERAREVGVQVVEIAPWRVRKIVVGNPNATKIQVAEALIRHGFGDLESLVPKRPARAVLGIGEKDRYWLHAFDALGLAVAAGSEGSVGAAANKAQAEKFSKRSTDSSSSAITATTTEGE